MKSHDVQRDLIRENDSALAKAYREAAETALRNPFETPDAAQRRAETYLAIAQRYEGGGKA